MQFVKRMSCYALIILLAASIYHDVANHTPAPKQSFAEPASSGQNEMTGVRLKAETDDTVLSIVEDLNKDNQRFHIEIPQIIHDFETINPNTDPHYLQPGHYYLFPLYHDNIK